MVFHDRSSPATHACLLQDDLGVVLGALFSRVSEAAIADGRAQTKALGVAASRHIINSEGRALVEEYWGDYIAFLRHPENRRSWVLVGPMISQAHL